MAQSSWRVNSVHVGLAVVWLALTQGVALAQTQTAPPFSRRPWVGMFLGWDFVRAEPRELESNRDGLATALSLEVPIDRTGGIRASVGRVGAGSSNLRSLSIRYAGVGGFVQHPLFADPTCEVRIVGGVEVGHYWFEMEGTSLQNRGRIGYSAFAGSECAARRMSLGVLVGGRFIKSPDRTVLDLQHVIVIDLVFTFKLRL